MRIFLLLLTVLFVNTAYADDQKNFNAIVDNALQKHPSFHAAQEELNARREEMPQAKSGWRPSLNAETGIFTSHVDSNNFGSGDGATTKDITLNINQPIWRGGRTFSEVDQARYSIMAGEAVLAKARQDIVLNIARATIGVVRARETLALRQRNEDLFRNELNAVIERVEMGDLTMTDARLAKLRQTRARTLRQNAQSQVNNAESSFKNIAFQNAPANLSLPPILALNPSQDLTHHPEILNAQHEYLSAKYGLKAIRQELMPQLSAYASLNRQWDPQPGIVDKSASEVIGLRATLALYEGGATRSRIRQATHTHKRLEYIVQDVENNLRTDIARYSEDMNAAQERMNNSREEIDAAHLVLEGMRAESIMGQRSLKNVLDAEQDTIDAQLSLINAEGDARLAHYELAQAYGALNILFSPHQTNSTP